MNALPSHSGLIQHRTSFGVALETRLGCTQLCRPSRSLLTAPTFLALNLNFIPVELDVAVAATLQDEFLSVYGDDNLSSLNLYGGRELRHTEIISH
jgi:hypothetical protein